MSTFRYYGFATDLRENALSGSLPRMTVMPREEAWGPNGVVSATRRTVPLAEDGAFNIELIPSDELLDKAGRPIPYVLDLVLSQPDATGAYTPTGFERWEFIAQPGGGPVIDMGPTPLYRVFIGPPWPPEGTPGLYIDTESPNSWGMI
jgi:hypothetical protein